MMLFARQFRRLRELIKNYLSLPAVLWIMLWFSINTGPWVLEERPEGLLGHLHYIRTLFPLLVIFISLIFISVGIRRSTTPWVGPLGLWFLYGLVGLSACVTSPSPFQAAYWALAYLSAFGAIKISLNGKNPLDGALQLNYLTWFITSIFVSILVFVARDVLFVSSETGLTGYGLVVRMPTVGSMPMSRSSGMARFAAIPSIISFVLFWRAPKWQRVVWGVLFLVSGALIYLMQSRGAILGMTFSLAFVMLFLGKRSRLVGSVLIVIVGAVLLADTLPREIVHRVPEHLQRHQSEEELMSMTGRTRIWGKAMTVVWESPIIGWGFQADRFLIDDHVHNTYLYALLTSGFTGAAAFAFGLIWAWKMYFRILRSRVVDGIEQKVPFIICGGILAFFSVRSFPEVSGALFGVDYMIMLPAIAYIGLLSGYAKTNQARKSGGIRIRW